MERCGNNILIILFEEHRNWNQTLKYQAHSPHPCSDPSCFFSLFHTPPLTHLDALAEVNGERATPQERAGRLGFSGLICAYLELVNNAWDVGARGSAGIKWLSARYPSIPGPSRSAPQVSFSPSSGGNFHALLGKHFPGHIFNYSESRADSHPSGSLSQARTHAADAHSKQALLEEEMRSARGQERGALVVWHLWQTTGLFRVSASFPSVPIPQRPKKKTIASVKSVKNIRTDRANEQTVILSSVTFSKIYRLSNRS